MADCHVDVFMDARSWLYRAAVVHTATGRQLYVTWPYAHERSAFNRATRWMRDEYARADRADGPLAMVQGGLFDQSLQDNQTTDPEAR